MNQDKISAEKLENEIDPSGVPSVKSAFGICALGLAAALLVVPLMSDNSETPPQIAAVNVQSEDGIDRMTTASTSKPKAVKRYTIRRNVLQKDPNEPCIIYENGKQEGGC